ERQRCVNCQELQIRRVDPGLRECLAGDPEIRNARRRKISRGWSGLNGCGLGRRLGSGATRDRGLIPWILARSRPNGIAKTDPWTVLLSSSHRKELQISW